MLLLVMEAEFDQGPRIARAAPEQFRHGIRDMTAIGHDFVDTGPRDKAALRTRMPRTDGLVVRIEEKFIGWIVDPMFGHVRAQHEGLEEPRRVREVPLGRAGIRHRLHGLVLGRERRRQLLGPAANSHEKRNGL